MDFKLERLTVMLWTKRFLSVSLVFFWFLPSLSVWGTALHLVIDHHGEPRGEHAHLVSALAEVAAHGHHHEEAEAPAHSHDATFTASKVVERRSLEVVAALAPLTIGGASPPTFSVAEAVPRRGPPTPLFTAHCSLLL